MTRRTYTGPLLDVTYDREICEHAAECVRGMPSVFDTHKKPWIDPRNADTAEHAEHLREVVGRCPSDALEIAEHATAP